jgi:hypothetical protein
MAALHVVHLNDYQQDFPPYVRGRVLGLYCMLGEDFVKVASRHECRVLAQILREFIAEATAEKYTLAVGVQYLEQLAREPGRAPFNPYETQPPAFD